MVTRALMQLWSWSQNQGRKKIIDEIPEIPNKIPTFHCECHQTQTQSSLWGFCVPFRVFPHSYFTSHFLYDQICFQVIFKFLHMFSVLLCLGWTGWGSRESKEEFFTPIKRVFLPWKMPPRQSLLSCWCRYYSLTLGLVCAWANTSGGDCNLLIPAEEGGASMPVRPHSGNRNPSLSKSAAYPVNSHSLAAAAAHHSFIDWAEET